MTTKLLVIAALAAASACAGAERATYNSAGALTSLLRDGYELPIGGSFEVTFVGGIRQTLQPQDQKTPIERAGLALSWRGIDTFPNGTKATYRAAWAESAAGVAFDGTATAGGPLPPFFPKGWGPPPPLDLRTVDYVLDLPRDVFAGGRLASAGIAISPEQPPHPTFYRATTGRLVFTDRAHRWTLALTLDRPRPVTVTDVWNDSGRFYRVRIELHRGSWPVGDAAKLDFSLNLAGRASAPPAHLTVAPGEPRYPFDGFGADYAFRTDSPVTDYMLKHLRVSWARCEFDASRWASEQAAPGPDLVSDFKVMQRLQQSGVPWVLTVWRLPERFYEHPNSKPSGAFGRHIAADRWPELLDLLGTYLDYLKRNYGAEPDLFSFNESDLGVDIGFTGKTHRDMIERVGAWLKNHGYKTRMLLGDTANPRGTYRFALPTAADPKALAYVGAVSFHSWGNGTTDQYAAWGDLAAWIHRPLLVGEAGVDPGAWRNDQYDSYAYGLLEMRQYQNLLRYARPQSILYWEFTDDYSLVHVATDGRVAPTARFYLMKHFTNLTPEHSEVVGSSSDQPGVLVSAFARGRRFVVHILNTGPARSATLAGLPSGAYEAAVTTEATWFAMAPGPVVRRDGAAALSLPARSLTTLVRRPSGQ
ncbi:MAG: hypothetical protein ACREFX_07610 [Opitutaceae bacterium]